MKRIIMLMLSGLFSMNNAMADDVQTTLTPSIEAHAPSSTQQWLELQRSGKSASPQAQPISGEVMDKVHKRYLKSFEKPIPEFYGHETPISR
ncbi:DUF3613 domain-containing protein [Methylotenera sp. 1P/1]|uniref:DUF3613 domain-containing protein n=1 Tax=Methylotenera sp. 1P/1 TaxID=1131551 RepID=UPI000371E59C|nr:DUF3613 domain-containing protein [Methylotenera sp. 1P/1]